MFFKMLLLSCAGLPLITGGAAVLSFGKRNKAICTPGLLFHTVCPGSILSNLSCITVKKFTNTIMLLKNSGYQASTIHNSIQTPISSDIKKVHITFDDGFQSVADYALPILENAGFKASMFCVTDFIGKSSSWDVYGKSLHLDKLSIRTIADNGHEIGSHSSTHANLPYLSDSCLKSELCDSKKCLEDIIGKPVTSLSFPFGSWDNRVWNAAKNAGYTAATLYRNHRSSSDTSLFPVYGVYQFDTPSSILSKINQTTSYSIARATSVIMSHFSKGTPLWRFRQNYTRIPY